MDFTKAHGTGNDFVVLADLDDDLDLGADLVRALCDRRFGIGGDGILRLGRPTGGADVFMDYRNADGTIVEMCGNGVRVVAKHVVDHGLVTPRGDTVVVGTRAGDKPVTVHRGPDGLVAAVTVDMGPPILDPTDVPFLAEDPGAVSEPFPIGDTTLEVSAVSMGNPHAVTVVDDVTTAPVRSLGPAVEVDGRFPKHTNVEFAEVVSDHEVRLRVWERGVGETAACGTGACATVVALQRRGLVGTAVDVHLPGGVLAVRYDPQTHPSVHMTGPAVEVGSGTLDGTWLAAARAGRVPPTADREASP
ncbi:MAG: diaminopimelate epimerase [Actinobacteria bacterium]|nr:diaminopimelate epimerase [Actinomycetota bacterium]